MTKESDDYEIFISELIDNIKKSGRNIYEINSIKDGKRNNIVGASGQRHQIDISFLDNSFEPPRLVLIECKRQNKKSRVSCSVPKILKYNMLDIGKKQERSQENILGIIVTTSNFQIGAKTIADYENIKYQVVNDKPPYGFSYENIIQLHVEDYLKVTDGQPIVKIQ
jgi:hypothetical protein